MRIIGGEARSRTLKAPSGTDTRPTLDQVRESLFNILQFRIRGKSVLDLYAGSGAIALEALSRGAVRAVLCDSSREAARVIAENIKSLGYEEKARLLPMPDMRATELLAAEKERFDYIFLDPPYKMNASPVIGRLIDLELLNRGGTLIVEHLADNAPAPDGRLERTDERRYRDTRISFFTLKEDADDEVPVSGQL